MKDRGQHTYINFYINFMILLKLFDSASKKICGRPPTPPAAWIHNIHATGGVSVSTTMVMLFVMLVVLCGAVWSSSLVMCRKVRENNLKMGLWVRQCGPPRLAPYLM